MGTTVSLLLPEDQAEQGIQIVRDLFAEWEQALSRFLPDSELSRLNATAGTPVAVSDLLYTVLATALTAARATEGVYDPALLEQLERIGYDRTFDDIRAVDFEPIIPGEPGGRWRGIKVNPIYREVTLPAGIRLDFGGIAKGMAVDAAVAALSDLGVEAALVNAGGDLAVLGLPPNDMQWTVAIAMPDGHRTASLQRGAIATSGVARRRWRQGHKIRHHLLDPRSGLPASSGVWSVSVAAARCAQAEVAAKAAFILGPNEGARFLWQRGLSGLFVTDSGDLHAVGLWPHRPRDVPQ